MKIVDLGLSFLILCSTLPSKHCFCCIPQSLISCFHVHVDSDLLFLKSSVAFQVFLSVTPVIRRWLSLSISCLTSFPLTLLLFYFIPFSFLWLIFCSPSFVSFHFHLNLYLFAYLLIQSLFFMGFQSFYSISFLSSINVYFISSCEFFSLWCAPISVLSF